jgi:uncharacterized protein
LIVLFLFLIIKFLKKSADMRYFLLCGFQAAAAMEESALVKNKKLPTSKEVAEYGYTSMMKGKTVAIHGLMNWIMANSVRFVPRSMVVKITRKIQDKAN